MSVEPFIRSSGDLELDSASTTAELVTAYLRRLIHRGELGPGDQLPAQRELAEALGIGRVTLRQALQVLEDEGYLIRRRGAHGGTFLTDLAEPLANYRAKLIQDREGFEELFDLREGIEVQIVRVAAARRTADDLSRLTELNDELRTATSHADMRRADLAFHGHLAQTARNQRLGSLMYRVRGELLDHVLAKLGASARDLSTDDSSVLLAQARRTADDHRAVLDGLSAGDADAADTAMRAYLRASRRELLDAFQVR